MPTSKHDGPSQSSPSLQSQNVLATDTTKITKNYSMSSLQRVGSVPGMESSISRPRQSLDATTLWEMEGLSKRASYLNDHGGDHSIGPSGLRRIRQHPSPFPMSTTNSATPSRSGSLTLATAPNQLPSTLSLNATSPSLAFAEDLNRFPSESLHSFSFATQFEDSMHKRQSILKRSIDFMRDRKGWAASSPGLVSAQARLSGDASAQSMLELLSRSNLIGSDAQQAHGLGLQAPLTGPAELSGANVFEQSFVHPRSISPESITSSDSPNSTSASAGISADKLRVATRELEHSQAIDQHDAISPRQQISSTFPDVAPFNPRAALKRTFTSTDDLAVQSKISDVLAQPYTVAGEKSPSLAVGHHPASHPLLPVTSLSLPPIPLNPHAPVPHGHGNRWASAAQAIFMTEAHSPWTITAANDLACLVFGVTQSEVRRLGILEVVREERRKWLEEKLRDPESGSRKGSYSTGRSRNPSPNSTATLKVGTGLTAKLLSKPSSRQVAANRRSQTEDGSGRVYSARAKAKEGGDYPDARSRGVILCGDVVPIRKRDGTFGSASLWVKEKKGGLIWVLEEIAEDIAYLGIDGSGCLATVRGSIEAIWGQGRVRPGMDVLKVIPDLPKKRGTNTGALDFELIQKLQGFTARSLNDTYIPITIEQHLHEPVFRVSSFPHIAGILVLNSKTLRITSSNAVFSLALFGYTQTDGLHINDIIPGFASVLDLMMDEDQISLVEGIVIPEHSFRRARALLAFREGKTNAAAAFLKPSGMLAKHRDGAEILVDVQMRVARSERMAPEAEENAVSDSDETEHGSQGEVMYALWITYSRHLHAESHGVDLTTPLASRPSTPPSQPPPDKVLPREPPSPQSAFAEPSESKRSISPRAQKPSDQADSTSGGSNNDVNVHAKKTIDDFVVLEDMGQGAYGQVKLCRSKKQPQKKVVIKYVTKRRILVDTWTRDRRLGTVPLEIHVLDYLRRDGLKHPNIVEMSDFFEDEVNYYIEMVPHGLPGMDLFDYIELRVNMDQDECRKIFIQVAEAVWHLHIKAKVVHRDIKDENVILDGEGNIKLIDFGSAAYIKNGPFDVFVGTIDYAAPEVLAGQSYRGKEQDVWALGILLYTIVYKENPFYSIDEIMDHDLRVPYVMSEASIDLIRLMLNRDVDRRITISEVLDHEWCKGARDLGKHDVYV